MATKRITRLQIISPIFLGISFLSLFCSHSSPVSLDYYEGTEKILGKSAPSPPTLFYDPETYSFSWTASLDPDTEAEVSLYFFYHAFGKLPNYLLDENFLIGSEGKKKNLTLNWQSLPAGVHYFWVTGFDGGRESPPSNIIEVIK